MSSISTVLDGRYSAAVPPWRNTLCRCFLPGYLSVEPYTAAERPPTQQELHDLVSLCDVFSPNESEAASMVGPGSPQQLVDRLLDLGPALVTLRQGPQGALIKSAATGEAWQVRVVEGYLSCL